MTLDQFVQAVYAQSGKTAFTMADVQLITEAWIELKKAAAVPFEGWQEQAKEVAR